MTDLLKEFRDFALKGNLIELGTALVLALAFKALVRAPRAPSPLPGRWPRVAEAVEVGGQGVVEALVDVAGARVGARDLEGRPYPDADRRHHLR